MTEMYSKDIKIVADTSISPKFSSPSRGCMISGVQFLNIPTNASKIRIHGAIDTDDLNTSDFNPIAEISSIPITIGDNPSTYDYNALSLTLDTFVFKTGRYGAFQVQLLDGSDSPINTTSDYTIRLGFWV